MTGSCSAFLQLLSARVDGALDGAHAGQLAEHLGACPSCRARELALLAQGEALRAGAARRLLELEASGRVDLAGFSERVLRAALAREAPRRPSWWERRRLALRERWEHQRLAFSASLGTALAGIAAVALFGALPHRAHPLRTPLPLLASQELAGTGAGPGPLAAQAAQLTEASIDELELMTGTTGAVFELPGQTTVIWLNDEAIE